MMSEIISTTTMNLGVLPSLAMLIFMAVFAGALVHLLRMKKDHVKAMSALPLHDPQTTTDTED